MRTWILFLVVVAVAPIASAQTWRKLGNSYPFNYLTEDTPEHHNAYRWTNSTQSPQLHAVGGYFDYLQTVYGDEDTGPAWTTLFGTLSYEMKRLQWEMSETVPAGKTVGIDVHLLVDDGKETWYFGTEEIDPEEVESLPPFVQRSRIWKTLDTPGYTIYKNW